jgi:hypothetical protein
VDPAKNAIGSNAGPDPADGRGVWSQPASTIPVTHKPIRETRTLVSLVHGLTADGSLDVQYERIAGMVQSRHDTVTATSGRAVDRRRRRGAKSPHALGSSSWLAHPPGRLFGRSQIVWPHGSRRPAAAHRAARAGARHCSNARGNHLRLVLRTRRWALDGGQRFLGL